MFIPTSHLRRYILELEEDILEREQAHVEEMPLPNLLALDNEESVAQESVDKESVDNRALEARAYNRSHLSAQHVLLYPTCHPSALMNLS